MQTDELKTLANDFARRMSSMDWLTDALLIAGMDPSNRPTVEPGVRTVEMHVILIGPTTDRRPPIKPIRRSTRAGNDWIRVSPYTADVLDLEKFHDTLARQPLPGSGKELNIMVVHFTRRGESAGSVRCFMAHHEEMDQPGAEKKLADDAWVHGTLSPWLDEGSTPI